MIELDIVGIFDIIIFVAFIAILALAFTAILAFTSTIIVSIATIIVSILGSAAIGYSFDHAFILVFEGSNGSSQGVVLLLDLVFGRHSSFDTRCSNVNDFQVFIEKQL